MTASNDTYLADVDPLLRDFQAAELLHITKSAFWKRVADGSVPRPLKFGNSSRWPKSEILDVIEKAKAARSAAAPRVAA